MEKQGYSAADYDLVFDWSEHWLGLIELENDVTVPQPPTENDEVQYQNMRSWLLSHQEQFVPLWEAFDQNRQAVSNTSDIGVDADSDFPKKYRQNPFLFFYEPDNLYELAKQAELQSGTLIWDPSEEVAKHMRPLLIELGRLMIDFLDWMEEHVGDLS